MAAPIASHPGTYGFAMLAAAALVSIGASYDVGIFFFAGWLLLVFTTVMFVQDLGRRSWRLYQLHRALRRAASHEPRIAPCFSSASSAS